jgi:hypothetical protein
VVSEDARGRVALAKAEIDFALEHQDFAFQIIDAKKSGSLPLRVTHNDLKFNNVLFDLSSKKAVAVIDLDIPVKIPKTGKKTFLMKKQRKKRKTFLIGVFDVFTLLELHQVCRSDSGYRKTHGGHYNRVENLG